MPPLKNIALCQDIPMSNSVRNIFSTTLAWCMKSQYNFYYIYYIFLDQLKYINVLYINFAGHVFISLVELSVKSEFFGATEPFPAFFTSLYFVDFDVPFQILLSIKFPFANNTDWFNVLLHVLL